MYRLVGQKIILLLPPCNRSAWRFGSQMTLRPDFMLLLLLHLLLGEPSICPVLVLSECAVIARRTGFPNGLLRICLNQPLRSSLSFSTTDFLICKIPRIRELRIWSNFDTPQLMRHIFMSAAVILLSNSLYIVQHCEPYNIDVHTVVKCTPAVQ